MQAHGVLLLIVMTGLRGGGFVHIRKCSDEDQMVHHVPHIYHFQQTVKELEQLSESITEIKTMGGKKRNINISAAQKRRAWQQAPIGV